MGKVKIKKKSTFIDMTAMSDVTVLLLTFFMLTSTFLQKEPTIVYTPSSVSEEKVPTANLVTILVSSADKSGKLQDPSVTEGKIFISFSGGADSTQTGEKVRAMMLDEAIKIYNSQHDKKINLTPAQRKAFAETNMIGAPFAALPALLDMSISDRDKIQSDLTRKDVGIPINGNRDAEGQLNDFQVWCKAIRNVMQEQHNNLKTGDEASDKLIEDLYNAVTTGKGVAVKADKDTPFSTVQLVFDNLQTMKLNKFSLLTALTSEEESAAPAK